MAKKEEAGAKIWIQSAQRRGLDPKYSYASVCTVVEINLVPRAEFLTTNIQAGSSLQPAGKIWGEVLLLREAWQILLTRSITTPPCICWETKPSRLGIQRKGFPFQIYILLSFVLYAGHTGSKIQEAEWFESLLKVPGIMYRQDGNAHFFKSVTLEAPEEAGQCHTVNMGNSLLHWLVQQSDTSLWKARGLAVTHIPVAENKKQLGIVEKCEPSINQLWIYRAL